MKYYNPHDMLTRGATLNFLHGSRGPGKTWAMKLKALTRPFEVIWMVRTDKEAMRTAKGFLNDMPQDIQDRFKLDTQEMLTGSIDGKVSKKKTTFPVIVDETGKTQVIFCALNICTKGIPFPKVNWLIFDEYLILEGSSTRYMNNELNLFADFLQTCMRNKKNFRVFLIGNPIDIFNPYFAYFHIEEINTSKRFVWVKKPDILIENVQLTDEWKEDYMQSSFHKIFDGTDYDDYMLNKRPLIKYDIEFKNKPEYARYEYNLYMQGTWLGVWSALGYIYVTDKNIDKNRTAFVSILKECGPKKIFDKNAKTTFRNLMAANKLYCETKSSRTKLLAWLK